MRMSTNILRSDPQKESEELPMKHWWEGYPWRMIQTNLRQIIDACHEEGIRVIARTDFSKVHYDLYEQHPE